MTYNIALKTAVILAGRRQIDVAAQAGIHNSRFSHIMLGRVEPTVEEKKAIAKVLRKPVSALFPADEASI